MQGVQLFIDIIDHDTATDFDLIDILLIDYSLPVGESLRETYMGVYEFITMDLNITVLCAENFGRPDCTECVPGFTGTDCQVDDCVGVNCNGNVVCVDGNNSFTFNCSNGYSGSECEMNIDDCLSSPCASTGQCVDGIDSFTCSCEPGYTGQLCETNIDDCEGVDCSGNGQGVYRVNLFTCMATLQHSTALNMHTCLNCVTIYGTRSLE